MISFTKKWDGSFFMRLAQYFFMVIVTIALLFGLTFKVQASRYLKIGLLEEPKTLNVWLASDAWSRKVLSQIYQPLYVREPDHLKLIPWLAENEPVYNANEMSYTIKLRKAKWSDGTPLTSEDVAFTGRFIKEFRIPRYLSKWKFIKRIETPDPRTVKFYLSRPKAIFLTRTLITPIVQKKQWINVASEAKKTKKPLAKLLNVKITSPIGSGPFVLKEWNQGAYLFLKRNPFFFGSGKVVQNRKLGPYIDGIIFKVFGTSDAAILALKKGSIDMFWWGIQPGYLEDLMNRKDIKLFHNEKSALYYMGFNVRRIPFCDVNLRRAVAYLIDKDFIISRILQGNGIKMYSIVPPGNRFWYCPDVPKYGEGLSKTARIRKAYNILKKAGYTWGVPPVSAKGKVVKAKGIRLPDGSPMQKFTILTPPADYDPNRAMAGMMIQEWLRMIGMPAFSKPMAFGALIQQVKVKHDFDAFILGYGRLSLDPDYLRSFFHSRNDKVRGWNMSGYHNPDFDKIADESSNTMEREKRRKLIWEMQKIILGDVPYIPLYNPKLIEGVRTGKFRGWVQMLGGIGNIWTFCTLKPIK